MMLCKLCGCDKPVGEFYACNKGVCKPCYRARVAARRAEKIEAIRAYDRERGLLQKRKDGVARRSHRYKHLSAERDRKYRSRHPEKARATSALKRAVRSGKIAKPMSCETCGKLSRLEGHHRDYSKPHDVVWLCRQCHGAEHRRLNEEKRKTP